MDIDIDIDDLHKQDVEAEVRVKVSEEGETIEIHRAPDGTIKVEREDADGNHSSATYDSIDQLREKDPDAHDDYRRFIRPPGASMLVLPPALKTLGDKQHEFQIKLKRQLGDAHERLQQALDEVREAHKKVEVRSQRKDDDKDVVSSTKSVMIVVEDDGRITVEIDENGTTRKYEFESREEFEQTEPELYERFRQHLDEIDSDAQTEGGTGISPAIYKGIELACGGRAT